MQGIKDLSAVACLAVALLLAPSAMGAHAAGTPANLTVNVSTDDNKPLAGAVVEVTPRGSPTISLTTDDSGTAKSPVPGGVPFNCTVSSSSTKPVSFTRTISAGYDAAIAKVILGPKARGTSQLAEWRLLRTAEGENPEKDFARFNFEVKYYRDGKAIAGATIRLTYAQGDKAGAEFKTLTSDDKGQATVLVPEGLSLSVLVTAPGYADYPTRLQPGKKATVRLVNVRMRRTV